MSEKASHKEDADPTKPGSVTELPDTPEGGEIAINPGDGDEIDTVPKWWDEAQRTESDKPVNRRLEEGAEPPASRRRRQREEDAVDEVAEERAPEPEPSQEIVEKEEELPASDEEESVQESDAVEDEVSAPEEEMPEPAKPTPPPMPVEERKEEPQPEPEQEPLTEEKEAQEEEPAPTGNEEDREEPGEESRAESGDLASPPPGQPDPEEEKSPEANEAPPEPEKEPEPEATPPTETVPVIGDGLDAAPAKRKAGCWTVFATLYFLGSLLVIALLVVGGIYAWLRFGTLQENFISSVKERLEQRGLHFDYVSSSYAFPDGIAFDEVTLYDSAERKKPVLRLSSLGMEVDLPGLIRHPGAPESAEISLEDAKATFYENGAPFAEAAGVSGELRVDAAAVVIERLAADLGGTRVLLDGVVNLGDGAPSLDFSAFRAVQPWLAFENAGEEPPVLRLTVSADGGNLAAADYRGTFSGDRVKWRGVELAGVAATFRRDSEAGLLRILNLQFGHGDGVLGAVLTVDPATRLLRIDHLQSTVDPVALLAAIDPAWTERFQSVRLIDAPSLRIVGEVPMDEPGLANLKIRYEHTRGFERGLVFSDIRGNFSYEKGVLNTSDLAANLFGGQVYVNGMVNLVREERPFTGLVEVVAMPLDKAAARFGQESAGLSGRLSMTFRGTGQGDIGTLNGGGNLRIEDASLPGFPVVGPVQMLLGQVVPAFGPQSKGTVSSAYILESGVLVTSDLTVTNGAARVVTNGSVNLKAGTARFTANAGLEPALAAATGLKDRAIQVKGEGPLAQPELQIVQFPVEFAATGFGEVLGTTPESLGGLKELLGENASEVIVGEIGDATGLQIDPAVAGLLKGPVEPEPAAEAPKPLLRAVPEN